jgi:hypothetical protein
MASLKWYNQKWNHSNSRKKPITDLLYWNWRASVMNFPIDAFLNLNNSKEKIVLLGLKSCPDEFDDRQGGREK